MYASSVNPSFYVTESLYFALVVQNGFSNQAIFANTLKKKPISVY